MEGGLYARGQLSGRGDSVRALAASMDGDIRAVIPRGEMRQTFAELMGIDATKGLFMLITKDKGQTPVRCAVADFHAQDGVLTARRFVFDTGVVLVVGKGDINLRDEAIDLQLNGRPKKFRLVRVGAPILVKGSLASPKFGVDVGKAAGQLAISGLLGAVVAPLFGGLALYKPRLGEECGLRRPRAGGQPLPSPVAGQVKPREQRSTKRAGGKTAGPSNRVSHTLSVRRKNVRVSGAICRPWCRLCPF